MMEDCENLSVEHRGDGLTLVRVERPKVLNALNDATIAEIDRVFARLAVDPEVGAVIVTGSGEKAFVAGADIGELAQQSVLEARSRSQRGQRAFARIAGLGKPVLAAINGFALGGGCELALSCHVRMAATNAKLGLPEVSLGIIPGYGGTQRLSRLVGLGVALEMLLTGDWIDAAEALRIGLVNRVCEPGKLLEESEGLARRILSRGPLATRYVLEAASRGADTTLDEGLALEADLFGLISATSDVKEGMSAFLEKRDARFEGR